jgi:hypothetical protein
VLKADISEVEGRRAALDQRINPISESVSRLEGKVDVLSVLIQDSLSRQIQTDPAAFGFTPINDLSKEKLTTGWNVISIEAAKKIPELSGAVTEKASNVIVDCSDKGTLLIGNEKCSIVDTPSPDDLLQALKGPPVSK